MGDRDDDARKRRSRKTSREAYEQLKESGKLSRLRWLIYDYLFHHGPATAQECFKALKLETNQSGRFTELRDLGVVEEVGRTTCRVTGREVIAWDVTDRAELAAAAKETSDRQVELEQAMRDAVRDLRAQNDLFAARVARRLEEALKGER